MKEIYLFLLFCLIFICLVCIFSSRSIMKGRVDNEDENNVVRGMKITFTVILILSLIGIYYIR